MIENELIIPELNNEELKKIEVQKFHRANMGNKLQCSDTV